MYVSNQECLVVFPIIYQSFNGSVVSVYMFQYHIIVEVFTHSIKSISSPIGITDPHEELVCDSYKLMLFSTCDASHVYMQCDYVSSG